MFDVKCRTAIVISNTLLYSDEAFPSMISIRSSSFNHNLSAVRNDPVLIIRQYFDIRSKVQIILGCCTFVRNGVGHFAGVRFDAEGTTMHACTPKSVMFCHDSGRIILENRHLSPSTHSESAPHFAGVAVVYRNRIFGYRATFQLTSFVFVVCRYSGINEQRLSKNTQLVSERIRMRAQAGRMR